MRKVKFSDCVEYMIKGPFGSDMKKSLYVPKGDNTYKVYIQVNAIQRDQSLGEYYVSDEYFHEKLERFEVHPGDYLITCDGTLGKFIKLDEESEKGVISSSLLLLKLKEDVIYDKYFELIWEYSMLGYLASQARNACLVHLPSAKAIGDVEIILPDLAKQIELADRAFSVSGIVEKRKAELALFDNLIKARFVELFGDPIINPKGWKKEETNKHIDLLSGYPFKSDQYVDEGINICGGLIIMPQRIEWESCVHWPTVQGYEDYLLEDGDIVMALDRPWITEGFKVARVDDNHLPALLIQRTARIRALDMNQDYLYYCFINGGFDKHSNVTGSLVPHISAKDIRSFEIMVPPIEQQEDFSKFMKQVDKSKVVKIA